MCFEIEVCFILGKVGIIKELQQVKDSVEDRTNSTFVFMLFALMEKDCLPDIGTLSLGESLSDVGKELGLARV